MKKHLVVITICTLALANAVPAMPVYAASKKPAAAYSAKQRREGQKKIKDAASRIKSAFKKQDLNALADLCSFPLIISYASGELTELKSKSELLALGDRSRFHRGNEVCHRIHRCFKVKGSGECRSTDGRRCRSEPVS